MNDQMFADFVAMVKDARGAGSRVFREWTANPKKFLHPPRLDVDSLLLGLTDAEREKFVPLLEFFTNMSFHYLLTRLEEGEANYSFSLIMKNDNGQTCSLIDDQVDHDIRNAL